MHKQITNAIDSKIILHNYIFYIRESKATLDFSSIPDIHRFQKSNWWGPTSCEKSVNIRAMLRYTGKKSNIVLLSLI